MKLTLIRLVLVLVIGNPFCALAEERMAVKTPMANIRSGPSMQAAVLWSAEQYFPLLVLEKKGQWYRFRDFENDQGWVHASMVGEIPTIITKEDNCQLRSGPGTHFSVLFTVGKGIPFKVLEKKGNWLQVEHSDGDKGWISKNLTW